MLETVELRNFDTGRERSGILEHVDKMPLMGSPIPVISIFLTYIIFVLKVGPYYMKNRKPFDLRNIMLAYNFLQVLLSSYLVYRTFDFMWRTGFFNTKCYICDVNYRDEILSVIWEYFMVKISDLFDTIFFILRKKDNQVTFLHVYHHSLMVVGSWLFLKYVPSENVVFMGFTNALIHFFMYGYYGLAALGPHMAPYLKWKKYLTSMQLVQFASQFLHYLYTLKYAECPPSKGVAIFLLMNLTLFIGLFSNFYREKYVKRSKSKLNENDSAKVKSS